MQILEAKKSKKLSDYNEGDRIVIKYDDDEYYLATVLRKDRNTLVVKYDTNEREAIPFTDSERVLGATHVKHSNKPLSEKQARKLLADPETQLKRLEDLEERIVPEDLLPIVKPFFKALTQLLKRRADFDSLDRGGKIVHKVVAQHFQYFVRVKMDEDSDLWILQQEHGIPRRRFNRRPIVKMLDKSLKISKLNKKLKRIEGKQIFPLIYPSGPLRAFPFISPSGHVNDPHRNWLEMGIIVDTKAPPSVRTVATRRLDKW